MLRTTKKTNTTRVLTVLIDPTVCSTTFPASAYAAWPRVDNLDIVKDMVAPAITIGGMLDSMTSERSQPFVNATMKPPKKVETN